VPFRQNATACFASVNRHGFEHSLDRVPHRWLGGLSVCGLPSITRGSIADVQVVGGTHQWFNGYCQGKTTPPPPNGLPPHTLLRFTVSRSTLLSTVPGGSWIPRQIPVSHVQLPHLADRTSPNNGRFLHPTVIEPPWNNHYQSPSLRRWRREDLGRVGSLLSWKRKILMMPTSPISQFRRTLGLG
jgi:hypothetical protein